jgi:hypothetical protein
LLSHDSSLQLFQEREVKKCEGNSSAVASKHDLKQFIEFLLLAFDALVWKVLAQCVKDSDQQHLRQGQAELSTQAV